jgi:hypothetical protein
MRKQIQYLTIPKTINVDKPMHDLSPEECPLAINMNLGDGIARKRRGLVVHNDFAEVIEGYFSVSPDHALVCTGGDGATNAKIYEWNYTTAYEELMIGLTAGEKWSGCLHVDLQIGSRFILTNGNDQIIQYDELGTPDPEDKIYVLVTTSPDADPTHGHRAKFVASLKGALYLAHTKEYNTGTAAWEDFKVRLRFSSVGDAQVYNDDDMESFPQNGIASPITSLNAVKDTLFMGKDDMLWQITPYTNYNNLWDTIGTQNNQSVVTCLGQIMFVNNGDLVLATDATFLSKNVKKLIYMSATGGRENIATEADRETSKVYITSGVRVFVFDMTNGSWSMYEFEETMQVLGRAYPQILLETEDTVLLEEENVILAEEAGTSCLCYKQGDTKLVSLSGGYDDNGNAYTAGIYFPWDCCQNPAFNKLIRQYIIKATPGTVWYIDVAAAESQREAPDYVPLGTCLCDDEGVGRIDCDVYGVWHSPYIRNISSSAATLYEVSCMYEVRKK